MINRHLFIFLILVLVSCKTKKETEQKPIEFTIGVVADCQYCYCEPSTVRFYKKSSNRLQHAVNILNNNKLDYSIHLGDFIDKNFESFDTVAPIWNSLKSDKYHVLGNHDFSVIDSLKPLIFKKMNLDNRYYSIVKNNWRFIILDGNDLSKHGALSETKKQQTDSLFKHLSKKNRPNLKDWNGGLSNDQLAWVENELELAKKNNEQVGFYCHFPAIAEEPTHNLLNYEQLLSIIDKYDGVKFYFNGHYHNGGYVKRNGVHYLNFKGMVDTENSTSFATVRFIKDSILVKGFGREPSRNLKIK
ncbi:metallophosphoesterase [Aurantibacter crassamenti]|uniref:metallophosphoesterase n=1 Tax=Aurantibacter crassamenti TaxID=1837375 RepID=UPI00193AD61F|nr:metallophosphoesterase [Aurantibacter crassamenti]MBM1107428.1 metallophosphoesterase [Aurantibacter crassamenti]